MPVVDKQYIKYMLDCLWKYKSGAPQWNAYETVVDSIYHSTLTPEQRNLASMEALDAVTRRGHFDPKNYLD